ncbi:MAG: ABC transporter ATP-binding protein [Actinomycetota bacterium]|nr:ABC transporter ATP-binding protein [Actinomycetota bacterium]
MSGALSIRELVVEADGETILDAVDLEVPAGERVALVGPSGAGKTTLLRAIAGLVAPRSGEIRLGGVDQVALPAHKRRIAMVFQEPRLLPHFSVIDNVALPLRAAGMDTDERRGVAGRRLGEVGLANYGERRIDGLSGGEQQRVALARALCAEPDLLLLDEPLASLEPNLREGLRRLISGLGRERGLTTLVVTHDHSEAAELGESIALMLGGRIEQHSDPVAMFERPASREVADFFGVSNQLRIPGEPTGAVWAIRPEHVALGEGPHRAKVIESTYRGTSVRVVLDWDAQRIEADVATGRVPPVGARVSFALPQDRLWRIPSA